jgi:hypothetical protein
MKNHENDDQIIEGELGSSCSPKELASGDVGLHQFLFLQPAHTKQCQIGARLCTQKTSRS